MKKYITPSILNVEKNKRILFVNQLISCGIEWVHYDIMDGNFVPNTAIEIDEFIEIRKRTEKHIADAHLMVSDPESFIIPFLNWADYITIHYESIDENKIIELIKKYKHNISKGFGIAVKPATPITQIKNLIDSGLIKLVLVMSVEPGKGGQSFMAEMLEKVEWLRKYIDENQLDLKIQIDGGVNGETIHQAWKAGVDAAVSGSYLVNNMSCETIKKMY